MMRPITFCEFSAHFSRPTNAPDDMRSKLTALYNGRKLKQQTFGELKWRSVEHPVNSLLLVWTLAGLNLLANLGLRLAAR